MHTGINLVLMLLKCAARALQVSKPHFSLQAVDVVPSLE